ncbi:histidinol-phosphate transaminase [Blochmannia endosymbiont of Polyrhachis (Hedomyrma) turneri]|uniref:histidinol-phosphate transaminase n=1 Tax=Blochmannia endosymbiont of Polyrhachis (Hedomyrma) turneri TaxID=1505596 RepID=UPI00061A58C2|nr:histidinol-phosphate transaminase [Blochmannia endosymbiont of Polyrhachis (Hedomyrma) turneri]AKC60026.1 Histidinol-phosphate aminotransferase [Blochmannia endosymbiont of Polyrhachis (Hedomyrma) turneri]
MDINKLARTNILHLNPYQSARKIGGTGNIFLNANEYPISTNYKMRFKNINRYPMCQPQTIIKKYAKYAKVETNQILVSRGADESIELLIRAFCEPKIDSILFCPPTYGMYKVAAEASNVNYREVPTDKNWQLDISRITTQLKNVKLIYICNPNNPTGNIINTHIIQQLLNIINQHSILVIDEAYIDFCPQISSVKLLSKYPHLVILRTLSKAFALAGLRCGFTLAHPTIIQVLLKIITPYPLSTPVIDIAQQALSLQGIQNTKKRIKTINTNREYFIQELKNCKCIDNIFPSEANYILVRCNPKYKVFKTLWDQGIILRDQNQQFGLTNCLRISIGTHDECQHVISALKKLTNNNPTKLLT